MKTSILVLLALTVSNAALIKNRLRGSISDAEMQFVDFIAKYGRNYVNKDEYNYRLSVFSKKLAEMEELNSDPKNTFTVGVNKFTDWDDVEWKRYLTLKPSTVPKELLAPRKGLKDIPAALDWQQLGAVTPIKDQGSCGSCWSFSSAQGIEGAWFVENDELLVFSEQQLIDCSTEWGNNGCHGGLMIGAWEYLEKEALSLESVYPYEETDRGTTCRDYLEGVAQLSGYHFVTPNSPSHTLENIQIKPLSVGVEADKLPFQGYTGGIINSDRCGHTELNHAILLIGYGHDDDLNMDFWRLKNQWGTSWGEDGFVRMLRTDVEGEPAICGILAEVSYPILV